MRDILLLFFFFLDSNLCRNVWDAIGAAFLIVAAILDLGKPFFKIV